MIETAYLFQAVVIIIWWIGISFNEQLFQVFQYPGISHEMFAAFMVPDVVLIATLSLVRTYWKSRDLQFVILGAFSYASLFCVNALVISSAGVFPTFVMLLGLGYNIFICYKECLFRPSKGSLFSNAMKTAIQIVCVWSLALVIVPFLILVTFQHPVVPENGLHLWAGVLLMIVSSVAGLLSAHAMVTIGNGTPLPLDQATNLVTRGPYRIVRNPMAVAGTGQCLSVAVIYQSLPILVYCTLGALVWQLVIRPLEERDLQQRFGAEYEEYRHRVRCWWPKF